MKHKKILYLMVLTLFFNILMAGCHQNDSEELENYCYSINNQLKELDFYTAQIEEEFIVLYDSQSNQIEKVHFESVNKNIDIMYIRKENNKIYFVLNASIDDETGIMFINDETNSLLNGIKSIKRLGGNSYRYSTLE